MDKKLPGVFACKIDKKMDNNLNVSVNRNEEKINNVECKNIDEKINNIFRSTSYVYKADVLITMEDKTITKRIIGKKNNNLITIDNELIPISKIIDIEFKKNEK